MVSNFREYLPSKELRNHIDCVWFESFTQQKDQIGNTHLVIPDNTIELIFTEHSFERSFGKQKIEVGSHLAGLKTTPQQIKVNGPALLAIRFKPEGLYPFINEDTASLIDQSVHPEIIFGKEIRYLQEQIAEEKSERARVRLVNKFLNDRLAASKKKADPYFELFLKRIQSSKGQVSLKEMSKEFSVSPKTIQRKFSEYVGITPKKYSRLVRLIEAVKSFEQNPAQRFSLLAHQFGFTDQMHFIKEVKAFTGKTPTEYFNLNRGIQHAIFAQ
ncbi:MAG: AraC family transcriptional regulator [Balneola sp.]